MRILLIGDVFSTSGRKVLEDNIKQIKQEYGINFIVINGENIAHGNGITKKYYDFLLSLGTNVVTLGNHSFSNQEIYRWIGDVRNLVRPLNYGKGTPGTGYVTVNYNGIKITVFQVLGRTFEKTSLDCPFRATEELLENVKSDIYICDFHGEATSEKIAYGLYFDGRVNIIVGTHTHVQTNDAHILDKGTMYMSDLGMTGALDGVIGVEPSCIIKRFLTGMPSRHDPMERGKLQLCGLVVDINEHTHKVTSFDIIRMIQ